MSVTVTVLGTPAPQGSKTKNRYGAVYEASAKVKPWREAVKWAVHDAVDRDLQWRELPDGGHWPVAIQFTGPVTVEVVFTVAKPASAPKRRRTWPCKRPDLDKLVRATFDGITESGVIRDDAQVVCLTAAKCYPGEGTHSLPSPGAWIRITEVTE